MPSWNELLEDFNRASSPMDPNFLQKRIQEYLNQISQIRNGRNVLFYSSAFLQKPSAPQTSLMIVQEDLNGFMSVLYKMEWNKGLTLLIHTPGGIPAAAETIVSYLFSKFDNIEVIVPTLSMSAGTMISLAANRIIMGRQSQLGPIDPQMLCGDRFVSAISIEEQFNRAKKEILKDPKNISVWFPVLQTIGPALLEEAKRAKKYGETIVAQWLQQRMFFGDKKNAKKKAKATAKFFSEGAGRAETHLNHGRRIDRDLARANNVIVDDLEDDQGLQEAVLSSYHLITLAFEKSTATKVIESNHDKRWVKHWLPQSATIVKK